MSNPSPALHFLALEGDAAGQYAKPLVRKAQARVSEIITYYNSLAEIQGTVDSLTVEDIRTRLLRPALDPNHSAWRSIATVFITFFLEWDCRNSFHDILLDFGTVEPFFMHLFKGCLLFESLLKENEKLSIPNSKRTLFDVLKYLAEQKAFPSIAAGISEQDFSNVMILLENELQNQPLNVTKVIELTGRTRNTLGHNLGWEVKITKEQYHHLFRIIAASCLFAVARLHK